MTPEEKDTALFSGLVMMFHSAAMQNLGKIKNPATDKVEQNLEQAQAMIDMLDMLSKKTKGNLSEDESRFLSNVLQELKLNYVDEVAKQQKKG
jgi:ribosome recycling factor